MKKLKLFAMISAIVVLLLAVAIQFRAELSAQSGSKKIDLRQTLGGPVPGWQAKDMPIGETEEVRNAAAKTLHFDEYFFRSYVRNGVEFTVYVAYWLPGKYPPQLIANHTPDMCWTLNGMKCEEMKHNVAKKVEEVELWPAQWRKFSSPNGAITYTMFWHMVGDRPYDYGRQFYNVPNPVTFWWEALKFAAGSKSEQFFFRITSNVPPEQIWNEPGFQQAVHGFVPLGLARATDQ